MVVTDAAVAQSVGASNEVGSRERPAWRVRIEGPSGAMAAVAAVVSVVYSLWVAWFSATHSDFFGDDLLSDWYARTRPFLEYLGSPIDVHPVVLHRLVTYVANRLFPLDFVAATVILALFHGLGIATLLALLRRLLPRNIAWVLVALYCVNPYVGPLFWWWTAGVHRLPYVLAMLAGLFFYLGFRERGSTRAALAVIVCMLLGLGFYPKAALLPAYLLGVEVALGPSRGPTSIGRRALLLGLLCALVGLYVAAWSLVVDAPLRSANADLAFHARYVLLSWRVFLEGWIGIADGGSSKLAVFAIIAWGALLTGTIARSRYNLVVWATWLMLITLNFVLTSLPRGRTDLFGMLLPTRSDRYYFELSFLTVIFVGIALRHAIEQGRALSRRGRVLAAAAVCVALTALAFTSHRSSVDRFRSRFDAAARAHAYLERFREDLDRITSRWPITVPFRNGWLPDHFGPKGRYRTNEGLLVISAADAQVTRRKIRRFYIQSNGAIVREEKRRRRRRRKR